MQVCNKYHLYFFKTMNQCQFKTSSLEKTPALIMYLYFLVRLKQVNSVSVTIGVNSPNFRITPPLFLRPKKSHILKNVKNKANYYRFCTQEALKISKLCSLLIL